VYSYHGKLLTIDLTRQKVETVALDPSFLKQYLGGVGLATRLLYDYSKPGTDPLSPSNPLVFASSGLCGTMVPTASKHAVATKSPLTGLLGDSLSSSFWSLALKRAGYDALVITGAAPSLTYLFIDDGNVFFRQASHLAGLGCGETEAAIRQELGDAQVRVAAIGPGGEKLVRYACIVNDGSRCAGRSGVGAVMGSKGLKAIALRGSGAVKVADLARLQEECLRLFRVSQEAATEKYRVLGTPANVLTLSSLGALPTRNFQEATFETAQGVSGEHLHQQHLARVVACAGCSIACEHIYRAGEGPYPLSQTRLDYESIYALGPLCGVDFAPAVIRAATLCDEYGLDTISTGASIAWAMECFERGLIGPEDTEGLELAFGNHQALVEMVERIAQRRGLGDLLAEGVKRAAERMGGGSEHWAMHSKGLELPGYDPRSLKTMALGYAVGTRGGCHNRSAAYELDMSAKVDRFKGEKGRGALAMAQEDFAAVLDSLMLCKFLRRCFSDFPSQAANLYTLATGLEMSPAELMRCGERISNLKKAFNIREGWTRSQDWLPPRVFRDPIPHGPAQGHCLTEEELTIMIDDYYQARGWTDQGLIPREKLEELGLGDLWPSLEGVEHAAQLRGL
jgi:aldehyde:ferredoxin oxidoreductase